MLFVPMPTWWSQDWHDGQGERLWTSGFLPVIRMTRHSSLLVTGLILFLSACSTPQRGIHNLGFIDPKDVLVTDLTNDGLAAYGAGRYENAVDRFQQALSLAPDSRPLQHNLAGSFIGLGRYEEVVPILNKLLQSDVTSLVPTDKVQRLYMLGDARAALGQYSMALPVFEDALSEALNLTELNLIFSSKVCDRIATLLFLLGREEEARCYLENAVAFNPTPELSTKLLKFLNAKGDYVSVIHRVDTWTGQLTPDAVYELYLAHQALGHEKEITEIRERLDKIAKNNPVLQARLEGNLGTHAELLMIPGEVVRDEYAKRSEGE